MGLVQVSLIIFFSRFFQITLVVRINHDSAVLALLSSIGPAVAAGPLPVTLGALELTKHTFFALIGSFLQGRNDTVHIWMLWCCRGSLLRCPYRAKWLWAVLYAVLYTVDKGLHGWNVLHQLILILLRIFSRSVRPIWMLYWATKYNVVHNLPWFYWLKKQLTHSFLADICRPQWPLCLTITFYFETVVCPEQLIHIGPFLTAYSFRDQQRLTYFSTFSFDLPYIVCKFCCASTGCVLLKCIVMLHMCF